MQEQYYSLISALNFIQRDITSGHIADLWFHLLSLEKTAHQKKLKKTPETTEGRNMKNIHPSILTSSTYQRSVILINELTGGKKPRSFIYVLAVFGRDMTGYARFYHDATVRTACVLANV